MKEQPKVDIFEQLRAMKETLAENVQKQNLLIAESEKAKEIESLMWRKKLILTKINDDLFRMIKAILIFNNQGKPRLTKFYQNYSEKEQQGIIEVCNF